MTVLLPSDLRIAHVAMPERVTEHLTEAQRWRCILAARSGAGGAEITDDLVYGPLVTQGRDNRLVIGQFGQSLDGRIATPSGESKYLNGSGGLAHLHRLRALVDGVIVGVSTVIVDDPLLTVRMVDGDSPARIVIDPRGRVDFGSRLFANDGARRIVVTASDTKLVVPTGVELVRIAATSNRLPPQAIIEALGSIGFSQLLVEGGAETVSRFLQAGALDRLHVSVAPVLVGGGRSGVTLSNVQGLADCLRPTIAVHRLGDDILFDCAFKANVAQDL